MDKKEYQKQYRLKNKDRRREYMKKYRKQYYLTNKEKILKQKKQYGLDNKERIKQYYLKNQEKLKEYSKQYYIENQETIKEKKKVWNQNHQMYFLGKPIYLDKIEKTFSCMCCRFQGKTNLHHMKYDLNDPLKYTIELCDGCHVLFHMEENYLRFGIKKLLPAKELIMIENGGVN